MKFVFFHLMPWPNLPKNFIEVERSAWVTYPNQNYDPDTGHELYERYLGELVAAESYGFDAIATNEHHQTAYGLMPSPNLIAAMLVQRTHQVKIAILGNAIPLRDHPMRVAEEIAMLDVISGGRIICGFVRGIGPEYHTFAMNPATSLDRFREAHDLILASWTRPGPFPWHGTHYRLNYVNLWPRPIQRPHPPVWIPSQGSGETIKWAAERHYTFLMTFTPHANVIRFMGQFRDAAREFGYDADPEQMGWACPVYVGKDDETALAEAAPHIEYLFNGLLKRPPSVFFPPGYLTEQSALGVRKAFGQLGLGYTTAQHLSDEGQFVVGGPQTVLNRIKEYIDRSGVGVMAPLLQFGSLPHDLTAANMERFANQVMPALKTHRSAVYATKQPAQG